MLLKLAGLARTLQRPLSRWRAYCFVVVLPYEPVIATTFGSMRRRVAAAAATWREPSHRSIGARSTSARSISTGAPSAERGARRRHAVDDGSDEERERGDDRAHDSKRAEAAGPGELARTTVHTEPERADEADHDCSDSGQRPEEADDQCDDSD